jgi:TonB-dependent receptor
VQEGKFVFVRGLGERYTTTSLNGARVPSPEPERKVVPLDLFPAGLLQNITTSKTFTPDQPGDFSGAQVNIETREFPADRQFTVSLGGGFNTRSASNPIPSGPTTSREWLGFAGSERQLPQSIVDAGNLLSSPSQTEINGLVRSFRNAWSVDSKDPAPNGSFGLSVGGTDPVFGQRISYLGSLSYSRSVDIREEQVRAYALAGSNGSTSEIDRYEGNTGTSTVLWGGLLQLSSLVGASNRLVLNATYNRGSDNEARSENGNSENLARNLHIERLRFVERNVFSTQLKGEHELAERHRFEWVGTLSGVERKEPDRSEIVYAELLNPSTGESRGYGWFSGSNEAAVRTFADLDENAAEFGANYRLQLGTTRPTFVKIGGTYRNTERDAVNRAYSISAFGLTEAERKLAPEEIFDGRFAQEDDSHFRITPVSQGGSYSAEDRLKAGYAMADIGLSVRLRVIAGARVEVDDIRIHGETTLLQPFTKDTSYTDVLPSLSVNYSLGENMNLRLSGSQTLSRPEYREQADVAFRDVIGAEVVRGNSRLTRTLIQNADLRWEWYPNPGEVVSVALFGKRFKDPIERVNLATSGSRLVTFVNAQGADNYGVELELRKRMGTLAQALEPWTVFANATLMESTIDIGSDISSQTNPERAMVGQAPYVVNTGLTWAIPSGRTSATLLYNVVGRRIVSAGALPLPDVYEEARNVFDLSLRMALTQGISVKLDARNLLDAPFEQTQGSVTREYYRTGRALSLGLSWRW